MPKNHPLKCRCGTLQGHVTTGPPARRGLCYCNDCQAYAHFLERADSVLDAKGGTAVVATLPARVHFTQGLHALTCMSLSHRGLLRWYAKCCNTPIANTPRNRKVSYVGLVHNALVDDSPTLQQSFGPLRMVVNTQHAKGPVASTPLATALSVLALSKALIAARLSGGYKRNPFFVAATGAPLVAPRVLTRAERARLTPTR